MSIRPADDRDFEAIAAITNHYIATTAIHFSYEPVTADYLRGLRNDRHPWFVADAGDGVVGYAKAGTWRERTAYSWTPEIGVYLAPDAHRRGLGKALYAALLDDLAARGFRSAIACITLPNEPSIALHRAFGFVSVGVVREAGFKFERWHDVEFWQKPLAGADFVGR